MESLPRAQGIDLPSDIIETTMEFTYGFGPTTTSSMQRDVAAGKPFELEAFSGKIVKLGKKYGIPTPVHQAIYSMLKPALVRSTINLRVR